MSLHSDAVAARLAAWRDARARGEAPEMEAWLAEHPALAADLRPLMEMCLALEAAAVPLPPEAELEARADAAWAAFKQRVLEPAVTQHQARAGQSLRQMLPELEAAQKLDRQDVVAALLEKLHLPREKADKVRKFYHRLEWGSLDGARVHPRVYDALAAILAVPAALLRAAALAVTRPPREVAFGRPIPGEGRESGARRGPRPAARDEVDILFLGE